MKRSKANSRIVGVLAAVMALGGALSSASAIAVPPSPTYPAQMCQSNSPSGVYGIGSFQNTSSTGTVTAQCPIPNTWGGRIKIAQVRVVDRNPSQDFSCTIYVLDNTKPQSWGWWSTKTSSGASFTVQALDYGIVGTEASNHFFNMQCTVPAKYGADISYLKSYWIFED